MMGVCVRHTDDCTPVCVPVGSDDPNVKKVCTKGCNRLLKVLKDKNAKTEDGMYNMIVCTADKQVSCEPVGQGATGGQRLGDSRTVQAGAKNSCQTKATFKAKALCTFSSGDWNLGATCISNIIEGIKHPQCNGKDQKTVATIAENLKKSCRKTELKDDVYCSRLGISF